MTPHDRIIFALDVPSREEAIRYANILAPFVGMLKVGLELFIETGPSIIRDLPLPVMLDLKLHDIPETVERATKRAVDLGVRFVTIHAQQPETYRRVRKATEGTQTTPLVVTLLTSMDDADCESLGLRLLGTEDLVALRSHSARAEGLTSFVCSAKEIGVVRDIGAAGSPSIVVPGIRPAGSNTGDQKRVGTPRATIEAGATHLVIGRPIRDAPDPAVAAQAIVHELSELPDA